MHFPGFFDTVPPIRVCDPLADFLGVTHGGLIEYRYSDAVKLAGHSCPTVAGAWLLTRRALEALYGTTLPERGGVLVECHEAQDSGVTGVMASVIGLLTGAAGSGGFKGLAGRYSRRNLLHFAAAEVSGEFRFTRQDTGQSITAALDLSGVPADPRLMPLLQKLLAGETDLALTREFGKLWQNRVRRILIDHHDDPALVRLTP